MGLLLVSFSPSRPPPHFHDDPALPGYDRHIKVPPLFLNGVGSVTPVVCDGDGISGKRFQVLYAYNGLSRYDTYLSSFQQWSADADSIYSNSSAGTRHIRFLTTSNCYPTVIPVVVTIGALNNFDTMVNELEAAGYVGPDRKYLVFVDSTTYCGIATIVGDDSLSPNNLNNFSNSFARVDAGCWSGAIAAHETMHNLGGVQLSAPHSSGGWHCVDEYDRMCYSDAPYYPTLQYVCPDSSNEMLFDCNRDDYYSVNPSGYLATHWNVANSEFLMGAQIVPIPTATPCFRGNSNKICK